VFYVLSDILIFVVVLVALLMQCGLFLFFSFVFFLVHRTNCALACMFVLVSFLFFLLLPTCADNTQLFSPRYTLLSYRIVCCVN